MSEAVPPLQPVNPSAAPSSTRTWEVLCHLSSLVGLLGVPFGNILAPLVVWLLKRGESVGVDAHGKESLNFHISWSLYWLVAGAIVGILCIIVVGILMIPALIIGGIIGWVSMLILTLIGSVKASNGELYRYPLTIRFLK
ncbi:MAG TPA: DUF4870 domain-containing protein [Verrucomicrobiae bacterium]|nr:DUF4870 domain-containing protein [Verrucomicrobiae bacterium]